MIPPPTSSVVRSLAWILRVALVLQVSGAGAKYLFGEYETESPLFGLLCFDWQWAEPTVQRIDDVAALLNLACGWAVLLLALVSATWSRAQGRACLLERSMAFWQWPLLSVPLAWELATAVANMIRMNGFFPSEYYLAGTPLVAVQNWIMCDLASHAVRFGIPVALMLLTPLPDRTELGTRCFNAAMWVVRVAAAVTFIAHGLKAIYLNPIYIDYLLAASDQLLGVTLSTHIAEPILQVIGLLDLLLGLLLVAGRFRSVAIYMAVWGLVTACSRMIYGGSGNYPEVLIRAGNYALPCVAAVYFYWLRRQQAKQSQSKRTTSNREETA